MPELTTALETTTQAVTAPETTQLIADRLELILGIMILVVIVGLCTGLWWLFDKFFFGYT